MSDDGNKIRNEVDGQDGVTHRGSQKDLGETRRSRVLQGPLIDLQPLEVGRRISVCEA
jgi:hypothetical protein